MSTTVVSCIYGTTHWKFANRWWSAITRLDPAPDAVIVAGDTEMRRLVTIAEPCPWKHPQAFYLQRAIEEARTDWVWICDIDDVAYRDALAGLDEVQADVWQMGCEHSDGGAYIPPQLTGDEYLASERNVYVAGSAIRVDAVHAVGGFRDLALQDWDLWLRLASGGFNFQSSGRAHFSYVRHDKARGEIDTTLEHRAEHLAEMRGLALS